MRNSAVSWCYPPHSSFDFPFSHRAPGIVASSQGVMEMYRNPPLLLWQAKGHVSNFMGMPSDSM